MSIQPRIETERLILRPFNFEDSEQVTLIVGNKLIADVTANIPHPYPENLAKEWISSHSQKWEKRLLASFAITIKKSGLLIGTISLMNLNQTEGELGYWVGVEYWNAGYCSEACQKNVNFGFNNLKLKRIHAKHLSRNPASGKVLVNSGLLHIGSTESIWCGHSQRNESMELYEILST